MKNFQNKVVVLIKNILSGLLEMRCKTLVQRTRQSDVQSLLNKLKPVSFGGELIRLGSNGDGGYLVPDDLAGITACFSPGVDQVSGFERDCAELDMKVFMADRSVEKPAESHELFEFTKKYIGVTTNDDFMTLDDWVSSGIPEEQGDLLLQIDIEGFEYETFLNVSDVLLSRFRIIVAEFHYLDRLWNKPYFEIASRVFDRLLQTHSCVHNHPNNCCGSYKSGNIELPIVTELTFLRNDRIKNPSLVTRFPHPLDFDCAPGPSLELPRNWYG